MTPIIRTAVSLMLCAVGRSTRLQQISVFLHGAVLCGLVACALALPRVSVAQCEDLRYEDKIQYLDINNPEDAGAIRGVERNHFNAKVENLVSGMTAPLPVDIDFLLRRAPNHHRALIAMAKWQSSNVLAGSVRNRVLDMSCYFQRALAFRPDDAYIYLLQGTYQHRAGQKASALEAYKKAEELGLQSGDLFYNRGLLEFDLGDVEAARVYAERAYALGYPLPGLRLKLETAGPEK